MTTFIKPRNMRVDFYDHPHTDEMSMCYAVRTNMSDDPARHFEVAKLPDGIATRREIIGKEKAVAR